MAVEFDKFTHRSQQAMLRAQELAKAHDHQYVEPAHLLMGLLYQTDGIVYPLFTGLGIQAPDLRRTIDERFESLPKVYGGEVAIYASHIDEISYTHGDVIDKVGYHVRDYFVKQWDRFKDYPWGVLAHSTHLRGIGTYDAERRVERPRIKVTLTTGIPRERCEKVNLRYLDPATVDVAHWKNREEEGVLVVPKAGEMLYRVRE